jgi:hypothetical protein
MFEHWLAVVAAVAARLVDAAPAHGQAPRLALGECDASSGRGQATGTLGSRHVDLTFPTP